MDGLTLLKKALEVAPSLQVIMMTAFGSIESAVEAMRQGAFDYVTKPFKEGELRYRVERALERARLQRTVDLLAGEIQEYYGNYKISADLVELRNLVVVAELLVRSAQARTESRGLHYTLDYPQTDAVARPTILPGRQ